MDRLIFQVNSVVDADLGSRVGIAAVFYSAEHHQMVSDESKYQMRSICYIAI